MTKDEIIKLAQEAGFFIKHNEIYSMSVQSDQELTEWMERFASLVAEQEREKCAHICDIASLQMTTLAGWGANECSKAIRARKS